MGRLPTNSERHSVRVGGVITVLIIDVVRLPGAERLRVRGYLRYLTKSRYADARRMAPVTALVLDAAATDTLHFAVVVGPFCCS